MRDILITLAAAVLFTAVCLALTVLLVATWPLESRRPMDLVTVATEMGR